MFLADTGPVTNILVPSDGVTAVLIAFLLLCLVLPSMVKHRSQFYAAMVCLMAIIAVQVVRLMLPYFTVFFSIIDGVLELLSFVLLVLSVGGLTVRELAGDMAKAYEVIRRGETEKEVIIPIGDQPRRGKGADAPGKLYTLTDADDEDDEEEKGIPLA